MNIPKLPNGPSFDTFIHAHDLSKVWGFWYNDVLVPWHAEVFKDAVEVYGWINDDGDHGFGSQGVRGNPKEDTHEALLIGITPIKAESAEDLLRQAVSLVMPNICSEEVLAFYEKARKFLDREKK